MLWVSVLFSGLKEKSNQCNFYSSASLAPQLKFGITDSLWTLFRLSENMWNMLEPVEKIHALIDPAVTVSQHWGTGSVFWLPVSDTSCRKRESLNPVCKAKRCRHSAALGLTDERRWVDLESFDNTTAGPENINQSFQPNSEDSWQTGWADGAIFTGANTHNGGVVPFGHFWCLLIWTKVNWIWHYFWSRRKFTEQLLHVSVQNFSTNPLHYHYPSHTSHVPTRNSLEKFEFCHYLHTFFRGTQ